MNLVAQERTELMSCTEAGAAARCSNIDHDANPHLAPLRVLATDVIRPRNLNILQVEMWDCADVRTGAWLAGTPGRRNAGPLRSRSSSGADLRRFYDSTV